MAEEESSLLSCMSFPLNPEDLPGRVHATLDFDFQELWLAGWGHMSRLSENYLPVLLSVASGQARLSSSRTAHEWSQ